MLVTLRAGSKRWWRRRSGHTLWPEAAAGVGGDSSSGLGSSSSSSGAVGGMFVKIAYLVFLFCSIYCCIAWLAMVEPRIEMMVVLLFYLLYILTVCQYFSLVVVGKWCTEIGRKNKLINKKINKIRGAYETLSACVL